MKKIMLRLVGLLVTLVVCAPAFAQDGGGSNERGWAYLAAGLAIGIGAAGCGLGQGKAAAAALDGIARNPNAQQKIFTPMIIGLALIESLGIYALAIALILVFK